MLKKSRKVFYNLQKITAGELSLLFNELKNEDILFRHDFVLISKHFLAKCLPINTFKCDFQSLKDLYLRSIDFPKMQKTKSKTAFIESQRLEKIKEIKKSAKNENQFHQYICHTYLRLIKEPKEELLSIYLQASKDIKSIDNILIDIEKKLKELERINNTSEIQRERPLLLYYQKLNQSAKDELLIFLKNDIKDFTLARCRKDPFRWGLYERISYGYNWNPGYYQVSTPTDIENKFKNLSHEESNYLFKVYIEDKPAFYKFLSDYIENEDIVFIITELVDKHHLLNVRKEIIYEAVSMFSKGSRIMFANAVPTIIEGILHDLCILVGEDENELLQKGFQDKLNKLQNVFGYELYYEYYSFKFRLFRNKVAHGRLTKENVDELADILLLDLHHICTLVFSNRLKLNQKLFVIDQVNKPFSELTYNYVLEFLLLSDTEIPTFYKLNKQIAEVEKIITSDEFWKFLEREVNIKGDSARHGIYSILKIIKKRKSLDKKSTELFKKIDIKELDRNLANNYTRFLTKDF